MATLKEQPAIIPSIKPPSKNQMKDLCDIKTEDGLEISSQHCQEQDTADEMDRPILVGYAFGPKKMSTMGVVMAEASKTNLSSVSRTVLVEVFDEEDEAENDDLKDDSAKFTLICGNDEDEEKTQEDAASSDVTAVAAKNSNTTRSSPRRRSNDGNIMLSLDSYNGGLKNIVRYLHSSCSSVDTNSTTTTLLTMGTTLTGVTPSSASTCGKFGGASISSGRSSTAQQQQRLRVSFVPLDPDLPLEGQHGAKMDIILHKLTEDILCLSKFSPAYPDLVPNLGGVDGHLERLLEDLEPRLPMAAQSAILRVHRLMQYQKRFPDCSLADDPSKVLTLMSRSDIAHALADCLVGVTSASGIPVASPKFVVWNPNTCSALEETTSTAKDSTETITQRLRDADMSYPLIAKPLQAAGTKISHHMTVLLQESSLNHIQHSCCLLQEYANHDAVLYKVYVLGNNVHVYQRPSLPNLPPHYEKESRSQRKGPSFVDFDSQRPYPRLSAFGVADGKMDSKRTPPPYLSCLAPNSVSSTFPSSSSCTSKSPNVAVTAEEVQPIVDALKKAFGLELFGFDILITSGNGKMPSEKLSGKCSKRERQMLVVDVNYFPSYKEVLNFPSLLAQYLTQRAIDSRRKGPVENTRTVIDEV